MKRPLIIGNWKSYKNAQDAQNWFRDASAAPVMDTRATVVVCPPFPLLGLCQQLVQKYQLSWQLGAQNVSPFPEGKHTGEVHSAQLKEFVTYVLVGHSERRQQFTETDVMLFEKVKRVQEVGLIPIFFVQDESTPIPQDIQIVAYEPVFAIGTGQADNPENVEKVAHFFKMTKHVPTMLYGGSVTDKNVALFMSCSSIDGIVPGAASLDPSMFTRLIQNA